MSDPASEVPASGDPRTSVSHVEKIGLWVKASWPVLGPILGVLSVPLITVLYTNHNYDVAFQQGKKFFDRGAFKEAATQFKKAAGTEPQRFSLFISNSKIPKRTDGQIDVTTLLGGLYEKDDCKIYKANQQRYFCYLASQDLANAQNTLVELVGSDGMPACIAEDNQALDRMLLGQAYFSELLGEAEKAQRQYQDIIRAARSRLKTDPSAGITLAAALTKRALLYMYSNPEAAKDYLEQADEQIAALRQTKDAQSSTKNTEYWSALNDLRIESGIAKVRYWDRLFEREPDTKLRADILKSMKSSLAAVQLEANESKNVKYAIWSAVVDINASNCTEACRSLCRKQPELYSDEDKILWDRSLLRCYARMKQASDVDKLVSRFSTGDAVTCATFPALAVQCQRFYLDAASFYVSEKAYQKAKDMLSKVDKPALTRKKEHLLRTIADETASPPPPRTDESPDRAWLTAVKALIKSDSDANKDSTDHLASVSLYVHNATDQPVTYSVLVDQPQPQSQRRIQPHQQGVIDGLKLGQSAKISATDESGATATVMLPSLNRPDYYFDWRGELLQQFL